MLKKAGNSDHGDPARGEMRHERLITGQVLVTAHEEANSTGQGRFNHGIVRRISTQSHLSGKAHHSGSADDALEIFLEILVRIPVLQHQLRLRQRASKFLDQRGRNDNLECPVEPGIEEFGGKSVRVEECRDPDVYIQHYGGEHLSSLWEFRPAAVMSVSISSLAN